MAGWAGLGLALLAVALPAMTVRAAGLAEAAAAAPVPLMINNSGAAGDAAALLGALKGVAPATIKVSGRFTWDVGRREIVNPIGDLVATVVATDLPGQLAEVQGVVAKWALVRALERDAGHTNLSLRLEPDDEVHHQGDRVTLVVGGLAHPYFTLLGLAADGTVALLYPRVSGKLNDPPTIAPADGFRLSLGVAPPFGADHFVAIASAAPLTRLHADVKPLDGTRAAAGLPALLDRDLAGVTYQVGVHGAFSAPKP